MKYWQTKDFRQLENEWYRKLEKNGFIDIERRLGDEVALIQISSNAYRQAEEVVRDNRQQYYSIIAGFVADETFREEADRIIMTMVADGARIKAISCVLKSNGFKCHRQTVRYTIRLYEMKWGIKVYKRAQLGMRRIA